MAPGGNVEDWPGHIVSLAQQVIENPALLAEVGGITLPAQILDNFQCIERKLDCVVRDRNPARKIGKIGARAPGPGSGNPAVADCVRAEMKITRTTLRGVRRQKTDAIDGAVVIVSEQPSR